MDMTTVVVRVKRNGNKNERLQESQLSHTVLNQNPFAKIYCFSETCKVGALIMRGNFVLFQIEMAVDVFPY